MSKPIVITESYIARVEQKPEEWALRRKSSNGIMYAIVEFMCSGRMTFSWVDNPKFASVMSKAGARDMARGFNGLMKTEAGFAFPSFTYDAVDLSSLTRIRMVNEVCSYIVREVVDNRDGRIIRDDDIPF